MKDLFSTDLKKISIDFFEQSLKDQDLIPSRKILEENIVERFEILRDSDIFNLEELVITLKTPKKLNEFSTKSSISIEYLKILNREAKSYITKSYNLSKFPDIPESIIAELESIGIKTNKSLFNHCVRFSDRKILSEKTGIPLDMLFELAQLCDLSRINGVGPIFARILYESGIRNIDELRNRPSEEILSYYEEINRHKQYSSVKLREKDIEYCKHMAKFTEDVFEVEKEQ